MLFKMTEAQEKVLVELTEDWSKKLEEAYLAYKKLLNYKVYLSVETGTDLTTI